MSRRAAVNEVEHALKMSPTLFQKTYGFEKPARSDEIVLYCRSGVRAEKAGQLFASAEYANVRNFKGSFVEWFGFSYTI